MPKETLNINMHNEELLIKKLNNLKKKQSFFSRFLRPHKYNITTNKNNRNVNSTVNNLNTSESFKIEYNNKYNTNNTYESTRLNVSIIDLFLDDDFTYFLDNIKTSIKKMNKNIYNSNIKTPLFMDGIARRELHKNKCLYIFIIENLITDDLYNILRDLTNILYDNINSDTILNKVKKFFHYRSIENNLKKISNESKTHNKSNIKLIEIDGNIITINFQDISFFINIILIPYYKKNNKNRVERYKSDLLINIIIICFNYLYDNKATITKISKQLFYDIMGWVRFIHKLPPCININRLKEVMIKFIKRAECHGILYFTNISIITELIANIIEVKTFKSYVTGKKCE